MVKSARGSADDLTFEFITHTTFEAGTSREHARRVRSHVTRLQHHRSKRLAGISPRPRNGKVTSISDRVPCTVRADDETKEHATSGSHGSVPSDRTPTQTIDTQADAATTQQLMQDLCNLTETGAWRLFSSGAMSFRTLALQDNENALGRVLHGLEVDLSAIMSCYRAVVLRQAQDFNSQLAKNVPQYSRWEAFIFQDPVLLTMSILAATRHELEYTNRNTDETCHVHMLALEQFQLRRINDALRSGPARAITNQMLVAIALYSAYEAKHGAKQNSAVHLDGLAEMIRMRGGLAVIKEEDSYVAQILVWFVTNIIELSGPHEVIERVLLASGIQRPKANTIVFRGRTIKQDDT